MSKFSNLKLRYKVAAGVATGAAVVGMAGGAFAYWSASGSGGGSDSVASSNGTVTLVASFADGSLTPGGNVPVTIKAYNTGTTNLYVTTVSKAAVPISVPTGCVLGDFSLDGPVTTAAEIPAGTAATSAITVASDTLRWANTDVSQDTCKGKTITLAYTNS